MLIHHLYSLAELPAVVDWVRSVSPQRRPDKPYLQDTQIVFPFASSGALIWEDLTLIRDLMLSDPKATVPLLWNLCLCYDEYYESSDLLIKFCSDQLGVSLERVPFYLNKTTLETKCWCSKSPSRSDHVKVFVDKTHVLVTLRPTSAVQKILADRLAEVVFCAQAAFLRKTLGVHDEKGSAP
jgi:hypothetical protein